MSQNDDPVGITVADGICHIRMNRPHKKNALTGVMYGLMSQAIESADQNDEVKVIILSAEGPDYCAGNDIFDFVQQNATASDITQTSVFRFLKAITFVSKPLLAAVQGQAVGIGTTMLLHCDLVVAAHNIRLSVPFLKLGLSPEAGSSQLLTKLMGHQRAFEWLALGGEITAEEALRLGVVNRLHEPDQILAKTFALALLLVNTSASSLKHTKALMRDPEALWDLIVREGDIFRQQLMSPEAAAAFTAFMKK